jgi:hypothetical protein
MGIMMETQNGYFRFSRPIAHLFSAGLLLLLFSGTAWGQATFTITFDAGDPIGGLTAGATLSNQYLATTGTTFSPNAFTGPSGPTSNWATNTDMTVVDSAGSDVQPLGTPALVSGNLLHSSSGWGMEDGDASIRVNLTPVATSCSATFAGISNAGATRLMAFDHANASLGTATASAAGQQTLTITATGIASIALVPGNFNDWVGVDNITCTRDIIFANGFE